MAWDGGRGRGCLQSGLKGKKGYVQVYRLLNKEDGGSNVFSS